MAKIASDSEVRELSALASSRFAFHKFSVCQDLFFIGTHPCRDSNFKFIARVSVIRARIWLITVFLRVKNHHFCEITLSNLAQIFRVQGTTLFVD